MSSTGGLLVFSLWGFYGHNGLLLRVFTFSCGTGRTTKGVFNSFRLGHAWRHTAAIACRGRLATCSCPLLLWSIIGLLASACRRCIDSVAFIKGCSKVSLVGDGGGFGPAVSTVLGRVGSEHASMGHFDGVSPPG